MFPDDVADKLKNSEQEKMIEVDGQDREGKKEQNKEALQNLLKSQFDYTNKMYETKLGKEKEAGEK